MRQIKLCGSLPSAMLSAGLAVLLLGCEAAGPQADGVTAGGDRPVGGNDAGLAAAKEAFGAVARAVEERDRDALCDCFRRVAQDKVSRRSLPDEFAETPEFVMLGFTFGNLQVQQVSSYARDPRLQAYGTRGDYWHVIGELDMSKAPFVPKNETARISADIIRTDGRWRVVWNSWSPFEAVTLSSDSPVHAAYAVFSAIRSGDVSALWLLIDPELRAGQTQETFVAEAERRITAVERWRAVQNDPARSDDPLRDTPRPYLCLSQDFHEGPFETEPVAGGSPNTVRVWSVFHAGGYETSPAQRFGFELFVERDGKWYWRPKPGYTAWPLPANTAHASTVASPPTAPGEPPRAPSAAPSAQPHPLPSRDTLLIAKGSAQRLRFFGNGNIMGGGNHLTILRGSQLTTLSVTGDDNTITFEDGAVVRTIEVWGNYNGFSVPADAPAQMAETGRGNRIMRRPAANPAPADAPALDGDPSPPALELPQSEPVTTWTSSRASVSRHLQGNVALQGSDNNVTVLTGSRVPRLLISGHGNTVTFNDGAEIASILVAGDNNTLSIPSGATVLIEQEGQGNRVLQRAPAPLESLVQPTGPPGDPNAPPARRPNPPAPTARRPNPPPAPPAAGALAAEQPTVRYNWAGMQVIGRQQFIGECTLQGGANRLTVAAGSEISVFRVDGHGNTVILEDGARVAQLDVQGNYSTFSLPKDSKVRVVLNGIGNAITYRERGAPLPAPPRRATTGAGAGAPLKPYLYLRGDRFQRAQQYFGELGIVGAGNTVTVQAGSVVAWLVVNGSNNKVTIEDGVEVAKIKVSGAGNVVSYPAGQQVELLPSDTGNEIFARPAGAPASAAPAETRAPHPPALPTSRPAIRSNDVVTNNSHRRQQFSGDGRVFGNGNSVRVAQESALTTFTVRGDSNTVNFEDGVTVSRIEVTGNYNTLSLPAGLLAEVVQSGESNRVIRRPAVPTRRPAP